MDEVVAQPGDGGRPIPMIALAHTGQDLPGARPDILTMPPTVVTVQFRAGWLAPSRQSSKAAYQRPTWAVSRGQDLAVIAKETHWPSSACIWI